MPLPLVTADVPPVYRVLAAREAGNVLDLPFGYRDGFGVRGAFDDARMLYQTVHRHPMAGGFVARLPPRIDAFYRETPVFALLLRLSAGQPLERSLGCEAALHDLRRANVRYVVVNGVLPPSLRDVVEQWPLSPIANDGHRTMSELGSRCAR
jgi:hypothetical protein